MLRISLCILLVNIISVNSANFQSKLFEVIRTDHSTKNVIFSPISIEVALALGYFATRGDTAHEIASTLNYNATLKRREIATIYENVLTEATQNYNVNIINKIWVNSDLQIKPEFQEIAGATFGSEVSNVDFSKGPIVANEINEWVENATNQVIKKLISPASIGLDTLMVVINAIYFKGHWKNTFTKVKPAPFWINKQNHVTVNMMHSSKKFHNCGTINALNARGIEIPYKTGSLSMMILLPNEIDGLEELESKLADINIIEMAKNNLRREEFIRVLLPKFKIEMELNLVNVLRKLGVKLLFTPEANFGGLLQTPKTATVSNAKHKAFIDVDEFGSEAAAVTMIRVSAVSAQRASPNFVVNHPFVFIIKDQQRVYFMGHVVKF